MLRFAVIPIAAGLALVSAQSFAGVSGMGRAASSPDAAYGAARQRLGSAPLDAESYFALAMAARQEGDDARAGQLIDQALALAPRMRAARLWRLREAALAGNAAEVVDEASVVARLSPRTIPEVAEILAQLAANPSHRALIATRFANEPLIIATASQAAAQGLPAEAVMALLEPTDLARLPNGVSSAQGSVARALLAERRPAEARRAWLRLGGYPDAGAVFDGSFAGLAGAPPFGWTLHNGASVETSIEPGEGPDGAGALRIETFSSLAVAAAEQTVVLAPGRYRLRFAAAADEGAGGQGSFAWTIECAPRQRLAEIVVAPASTWALQTGFFTIPDNCPQQVLRLAKLRTPDQGARSVTVSQVAIDPA